MEVCLWWRRELHHSFGIPNSVVEAEQVSFVGKESCAMQKASSSFAPLASTWVWDMDARSAQTTNLLQGVMERASLDLSQLNLSLLIHTRRRRCLPSRQRLYIWRVKGKRSDTREHSQIGKTSVSVSGLSKRGTAQPSCTRSLKQAQVLEPCVCIVFAFVWSFKARDQEKDHHQQTSDPFIDTVSDKRQWTVVMHVKNLVLIRREAGWLNLVFMSAQVKLSISQI